MSSRNEPHDKHALCRAASKAHTELAPRHTASKLALWTEDEAGSSSYQLRALPSSSHGATILSRRASTGVHTGGLTPQDPKHMLNEPLHRPPTEPSKGRWCHRLLELLNIAPLSRGAEGSSRGQ